MEICVSAEELRKALVEIEVAEKNGFNHCLSIFRLSSAGIVIGDNKMVYDTILEKAHPTDGNFDWGRGQGVTRDNKFEDGKLMPLRKCGQKG